MKGFQASRIEVARSSEQTHQFFRAPRTNVRREAEKNHLALSTMRLFNDHRQKRATALLCMALLVIVSLSCTFILLENHHNCAGEDCPICLAIQQAQSNLTCLGLAENTSTANLPPPPRKQICAVAKRPLTLPTATLILLKVQQNK